MVTTTGATPRIRRLTSDYETMRRLDVASSLLRMTALGQPPHRYRIIYHCKGVARDPHTGRLAISERHVADIYLHVDYPRLAPNVVWRTAIFHPNIKCIDGNGTVCVQNWNPAMSLAEFVLLVGRMVQYQVLDPTYALDVDAAEWAVTHPTLLPVDTRPIVPENVLAELQRRVEAAA